MTASISVVIPCYNHAAWLPEAIESVLGVSAGGIKEIIIVNDGSTDDSLEVAQHYAESRDNIRIISLANGGPGRARNAGAKAASGEYLIFLDSDDRLRAESVHKVLQDEALWNMEPDVIVCNSEIVESSGKRVMQLAALLASAPDEAVRQYLENKVKLMQGAYMIRRKVFMELLFPETLRSQEDIPFFLAMLSRCKVVNFPVTLSEYHRWRGQVSRNFLAVWEASFSSVDILFESPYVNDVLKQLRRQIYVKKAASLMRSAYSRKRHDLVLDFFIQALRRDPLLMLNSKLVRKAARSFLLIALSSPAENPS